MTLRRLSALGLLMIVVLTIALQFALNGAKPGLEPWGARAWDLMRYFTILTCTLVALVMLAESLGRKVGRNLHATMVNSIVMVGVIYQVLLAPEEPLTGIDWWPDFGFHIAIPVLTALWWGIWGPKPLALGALPLWLLWPFSYCGYILLRGAVEGRYPYFFIDVAQFGAVQVAINIAGLVLVFALSGLGLWVVARLLPRSAV
jgi:hypothetical protein